ncbi:hypothetical protein Bca52824_030517 [Brassica carinata]|uniref:Uncharacterized protein n=1 Tax=Brassica carinata TaxID=52824 RepID=A0A8X7V6T4_BRACI|nr:hypothetical protein Bca52824_030517 [Brassica carinata]
MLSPFHKSVKSLDPHLTSVNAFPISGISNWPALTASKQVSKRLSKQTSRVPPSLSKASVVEISVAEEESLKDVSSEYTLVPQRWISHYEISTKSQNPEYMEDETPWKAALVLTMDTRSAFSSRARCL